MRKENIEFPAGRIESKDVDLTIKLDKAYEDIENFKNLPLKRAKDGSIITLSDVSRIELGAESTRTLFKGKWKTSSWNRYISTIRCKHYCSS